MKKVFVTTTNTQQFSELCAELQDTEGLVGPSLALVTGRAGRGKTEAARHYAVQTEAVYIRTLPVMTPAMVLREIAFELAAIKPFSSSACLDVIDAEMAKQTRLILVDEADQVSLKVLETLRGINERCGCPIVLIGEETLAGMVASRRRIVSRIRRRMVFGPLAQSDLALFYHEAVDVKISPAVAGILHRHSRGDWRPALVAAVAVERALRASDLKEVTEELAQEVTA